ncbi:unnamed protein product [Allacma fusca]|uniref:Uncharacterized protein n=1 Tax=Allacma fusca TaxID=39272 RepID=A0A8J2NXV7_9HEXA|nr:unnamed protein product [Allacma fusca]
MKRRRNICVYCFSVLIFLTLGISFLYVVTSHYYYKNTYYDYFVKLRSESHGFKLGDYLVNTNACKIVEMNPFDPSIAVIINEATAQTCEEPLVHLVNGTLMYNDPHDIKEARCCYNEIHRVTVKDYTQWTADWTNRYSFCHLIQKQGVRVRSEFVKIQCKENGRQSRTWTDFDVTVFPPEDHSEETEVKLNYWEKESAKESFIKPPSVLILGIDSISRLHMIRSLPQTRTFLEINDFVEMKGYTKIGENTFPNMMAALGGMKLDDYPCWRTRSTKLDDCPFIWKNFSDRNYITGSVEDSASLANFNYMKTGFVRQPVDYYFRPLAVAYHGNKNREGAFRGCVGGRTQTDLVLKYIQDFVSVVKNKAPYFFWSWFTTLAHDDFNDLRVFDSVFKNNLHKFLESEGDNAVILFISDHGYRFGTFRETYLGYYEESLPFFFIRIPPSVKQRYPSWYKNLKINSERLTSPLDLHATLEDILTLSSNQKAHQSFTHYNWDPGFRPVYSFFEETPENRTCESSNIPKQYCRCGSNFLKSVQNQTLSLLIGTHMINEINGIISEKILNRTCVSLRFKKTLYIKQFAYRIAEAASVSTDYLVAVEASPSDATFEARYRIFSNGQLLVVGNISRINSYQGQSDCLNDPLLKSFCYCS